MTDGPKGNLYSIASAFSSVVVILAGTFVLRGTDSITFMLVWFGLSSFYFAVMALAMPKARTFEINLRFAAILAPFLILEIVAAYTYFEAMRLTNPSFIGFFSNLQVVIIPVIGIVFMKERFNSIEICGGLLTVAGTVMMTYDGSQILTEGSVDFFISLAAFTLSTIIVKRYARSIAPMTFSAYRCVFIFIAALTAAACTGRMTVDMSALPWAIILVGSLFGPFLSVITYYQALKYSEMTRVVLIRNIVPILTVVGGYLLLDSMPEARQMTGGIVLMVGVTVFVMGKRLHSLMFQPPAHCRPN